ncbi:MAG TPA: O-antigen ligase family protein [Vicinamibacterales bacterium]|jgi:hypothetical protein|nr:O-antigen ligase family protein [Vicinamibacterales bacterium]
MKPAWNPTLNLERLSKAATIVSVLLIVALQLGVHPDLTWGLRGLCAVAFVAGWIGGRSPTTHAVWVIAAPLAPATLGLLSGREGPVVDLVWMIGLTGSLVRSLSWSTWTFPATWRVLLGGWALALSLAWPVLVAREIGFDVRVLHDTGAINSWAFLSAPQVVAWTAYVVLTQLLGVLWLDYIMVRFTEAPGRLPRAAHGLWIGVTLASTVAIYQGAVDLAFMNTVQWTSLRRASGTLLDSNAYGVAAAIAGPAGFTMIRLLRRPGAPALAVAVLIVNLLGVWMSGSRTAFLCGTAGILALAAGLRRSRRAGIPASVRTVVFASAAAVAIAVSASGAIGPMQRFIDTPTVNAVWSLWSRGGYGTIALRMIREYPLTGVGVGSYHIIAPDYWRLMANNRLQFDNAQNWWRHQAAELGVLGGLPVLVWSTLIAWRVLCDRSRPDEFAASTTSRGVLAGIGAASLLGVPTQNPIVVLWFFFLVAWMASQIAARPVVERPASRPLQLAAAAATVAAIAYAGVLLILAFGPLEVARRAIRSNRAYVVGTYVPESLPDSGQFRWTRDDARFITPARTRWLVVRLWANHPDIARKPVRITLSAPCGAAFEETVRTSDTISVGIELPEAQREVDARLHVSRTWKPSRHGGTDTRELGAGVVLDFVDTREQALAQMRHVTWPVCGVS